GQSSNWSPGDRLTRGWWRARSGLGYSRWRSLNRGGRGMSANDLAGGYGERIVSGGLDKVPETARFLQVSISTVYGLMARGQLAYVKLGRSRRVPHLAVIELAARGLAGGSGSNVEAP